MRNVRRTVCALVALLFMPTLEGMALSAEESDKKGISISAKDLPKPVQEGLEQAQRIGNDVGKEISKAAGKTAEAVNKAVKGNKDKKDK